METKPSELRRSKRTSHKIQKDDWFYLDFSDNENISDTGNIYSDTKRQYDETAKDELTGKGCVSYVEGVKFVEFETLEDMKLYDSVAGKNGNVSCASFNDLDLPFRGFSEVECEHSKSYLTQFKASLKLSVNLASKKASKSIKKPKSKLNRPKRGGGRFKGSIVRELHGEESFDSSCSVAKSSFFKFNSVGDLLTPSVSPDASYNNVAVSSSEFEDSEFDKNIEEDLLLTPQGSPALSEQDPLCSNSEDKQPIDLSVIPYIFKCSESHDCLSPKACAELTSHFTLCILVKPAKGRALSKSSIKYLNLRQDSNVVDRVAATIAASAVQSSANTIFLPLSKDIISSAFPKFNLIDYLESPVSLLHTKDVTLIGSPNKPVESSNLKELGSRTWYSDDTSNTSSFLSTNNSSDSSDSTDTIKHMKRTLSGSTPDLQKKEPLVNATSNSNNSSSSLESIDPLNLGYQDVDDASSPRIGKQSLEPHLKKLDSSSGCPTKAYNTSAHSLDKLYPRIVSISSLKGISSPTLEAMQPNSKKCRSSSFCPVHPNRGKVVFSSGVIDLTSENDTPLSETNTEHNQARAKKRRGLFCSSDQLPDKVIVIDDEFHETDNQLELGKGIPDIENGCKPIYECSEVSNRATLKVNCSLDSNTKIIDLTECSGVDDTQMRTSGPEKLPTPKVVNLTERDEVESPTNVATIATSAQFDVDSKKDDDNFGFSKLDQVREEVVENYSVVPLPGLQELAVMCTNVPSLGFIRVIKCSSGELMLNETFTARVYKQFDGLKTLNSYLNLRFEKMTGVKEMGPLEWILATAGVIKLKKVRPINPKVWFHPSDFHLTDDGPACFRSVAPSSLSKTKTSPRKPCSPRRLKITKDGDVKTRSPSKPMAEEGLLISIKTEVECPDNSNKRNYNKTKAGLSCPFKPVPIIPAECENTLLSSSKSLPLQRYKIPLTEYAASTASSAKETINDKPRTAQLVSVLLNKNDRHKLVIPSKNILIQNSKLSSLSTNGVAQVSTVNINETASNSRSDRNITVSPLVINISSNAAHSVTSSSKNTIVIGSATNLPAKPSPQNKSTVVTNQHYQTNQTPSANRVLKLVDCKPRAPHIVETSLNSQPSLQSKAHLGAVIKTSTGQKVLLMHNKSNNPPISLLRTGSVEVKNNLPGSNLVRAGISQNLMNSVKAQSSNINPHQVSPRSAQSLINNLVCQPSSQEFSSTSRSPQSTAVLVGTQLNQTIKTHQYKGTPTSHQTPVATQPVTILSTAPVQEPPKNEQKTKATLLVCASSPSGPSKDQKLKNGLPSVLKPSLDGSKTVSGVPCSNLVVAPTSFMSQVPWRPTGQPTKLCKVNTVRTLPALDNPKIQADQVSNSNAQGVVINKSAIHQRMIFIPKSQNMSQVNVIPMVSTAQSSKIGDAKATKSATLTKQHLHQTGIEKTQYPDAMIYYPSEAPHINGISVRKFSIIPRNMNSSPVVEPGQEKPYVPTIKPVEPIKSSFPKVVYTKVGSGQGNVWPASLKLHWTTSNVPKPS